MWRIYESRFVRKALNKLPIEIVKVYEIWKQIISLGGKEDLKLIK